MLIFFGRFLLADMEKILVTIRVRPLSKVEAAKGSSWKLSSSSIALCGPTGAPVSGHSYVFGDCFCHF